MERSRLRGVIVPMATPLRGDARRVNTEAVAQLVEHLVAGGVHGIFVAGTTGEGPLLEEDEWCELVRATSEACRRRAVVLAGVLMPGTATACRLASHASRLGADMIVATTPYYYPFSEAEVRRHLETIAAATDLPVLLYNIPQNTKVSLPHGLCARLASRRSFVGIKDSSGDLDGLRSWIPRLRQEDPSFRVFVGTDHLADVAVLLGADGIVPSLANFAPREVVEAFEAASRGDWPAASRAVQLLTRLMEVYEVRAPRQAGIVVGVKCALEALGLSAGPPAFPTAPPTDQEREFVAAVLRRDGFTLGGVEWSPRPDSNR